MEKKRVRWDVRVFASNYKGVKGSFPRVVQRGNVTLDQLATVLQERTGIYRADSVRAIMALMTDLVEEYLMDGFSVSSELGTLTPAVTGLWSYDRLSPEARAQNKAEARFVMSPRLKEQFADPLFREVGRRKTGPSFHTNNLLPLNEQYERVLEPDATILLKGEMLLMNGDDPTRGVYFEDADTGEVKLFIPPKKGMINTRSELLVRLNGELGPGKYRIRVVSQCSTGPKPLKKPQEGYASETYRIERPVPGE